MLVLIDNYDSFTFNLVQLFSDCGQDVRVVRHDECDLNGLKALQPHYLVVSPGPGGPAEAGISMAAIEYFSGRIPVLGVCLGHQCLAHVFGGNIVGAKTLKHGKTSQVSHLSTGLFQGLPQEFAAMRYHSLAVDKKSLPEDFTVSAWTSDDEIMGLVHSPTGAEGVQFHPESILSEYGKQIVRNFLN